MAFIDDISDSPDLDFEEDEVVDLVDRNAERENLKVSISNEEGPDPSITFLKLEPDGVNDYDDTDADIANQQFRVSLQSSRSRNKGRDSLYRNKDGGFETGIDLSSEDAKHRRQERAKRFGLQIEQANEEKLDVRSLFNSLGLNLDNESNEGLCQIRKNAILLRGVQDLHTRDIYEYFEKYPPSNLEWIDDYSCNIVFSDDTTCYRALLSLSRPIKVTASSKKSDVKSRLAEKQETEEQKAADEDDIDLNETGGVNEDKQICDLPHKLYMDTEEGEILDSDLTSLACLDETQVPNGIWRLADPYHKTKEQLFMKFATLADVKQKGAERKSNYYRIHGNPNFGGIKGLISTSRKRKYRREQEKLLEDEAKEAVYKDREKVSYDTDLFGGVYDEEGQENQSGSPRTEVDELLSESYPKKKRVPMMRMAADEEEEKLNALRMSAKAMIESNDVRKKLDRKKKDQDLALETDYFIKSELPDLRSRLSRANE